MDKALIRRAAKLVAGADALVIGPAPGPLFA
jgi:hypothetical protein